MTHERPILFSAEMVRAILDGRKTITRRVVKHPPHPVERVAPGEGEWWRIFWHDHAILNARDVLCPYGKPGDRLWVRETFCVVDDTEHGGERWVDYRATPRYSEDHPAGWDSAPNDAEALKWKPSIYMPKWASRITLEVTDIRVERVRDISEEDAHAEGFDGSEYTAVTWFRNLWDEINGRRPGCSWDKNPWVFVVAFRRLGAA
jgi:hypothetical protein